MKVLLLSAGLGSRLKDLTRDTPKCLLSVFKNGDCMLDYWIKTLSGRFGIDEIIINVFYKKEKIIQHLLNKNYQNILIHEEEWLYPVGKVLKNIGIQYKEKILIINSDTYIPIRQVHDFFLNQKRLSKSCIGVEFLNSIKDKGHVSIIGNDVIKFFEKQTLKSNGFVAAGIYLLYKKDIEKVSELDREELSDMLPVMELKAVRVKGHFDIGGNLTAYKKAVEFLGGIKV